MTYKSDLFSGRRVLITGGTSGIGGATALAFAEHGAEVLAIGLPALPGDSPEHLRVNLQYLDVTDDEAMNTLISGLDRLDVLVNCAGIARENGEEHTPEGWDKVLGINLTATMRVSTLCRPLLAAQGGAIINIASMYSTFGSDLCPAYAASKGGIVQLTKSLALAYVNDKVRVNAVAPGWIATPLARGRMADNQANAEIMGRTPMNRWGEASEVANAILFLASPAAAYVTGITLPVDGGYLCV